jgi:tetraacyldisaccharide 4'-kinase
MRTPEFWSRTDFFSRAVASVLSPLGWAYGASVAWKRDRAKPFRPRPKVICVGNLTAGGSGKTPVAIALAKALAAKGLRPFILSRGYGGSDAGPRLVDPNMDRADQVGDEALLLAAAAPTIVARDRKAGAQLADANGAEVIVMDDGHQNFALAKDLSLVIVDAQNAFGNDRLLPAGPLRESVSQGLARADAVVLIGDGEPLLEGFSGPRLRARIVPDESRSFVAKRAVAFSGIGRPEKFFGTLRAQGAELVAMRSFPDHHRYSRLELTVLREMAAHAHAELVTTEKDFVRLDLEDRDDIRYLSVHAAFECQRDLEILLDALIDAPAVSR